MPGGTALATILFVCVLVEWLTERLAGSWIKGYWLVLISTIIGVGVCFAYKLDLINMLMDVPPTPWGNILTGVLVGAGSDVVHSFIKRFTPRKK